MSKFKLHIKKDGRYLHVTSIIMDKDKIKTIKTEMGVYQILGNEHLYELYLKGKGFKYIELDLK